MSHPASHAASASRNLRLFSPEEDLPSYLSMPLPAGGGGISAQMTLSEFFEQWYVPIAMRDRAQSTIQLYRNSIAWWVRITGDPPLDQIDEFTLNLFSDGLAIGTFRRSRRAAGIEHPLQPHTAAKHQRQIAAILAGAGPRKRRDRPAKSLLAEIPFMPPSTAEHVLKPCFTLEQMRAMANEAQHTSRPRLPGIPPSAYYRGLFAFLFGVGHRLGTTWRIEWSMLTEQADGWWVDVPRELVPKTEKKSRRAIARWVAESVIHWPRRSARIFACGLKVGAIRTRHEAMQERAGIVPLLELQAWRRSYTKQMGLHGLEPATKIMQQALDHSDSRTTTTHYADLADDVRRRLTCPWADLPAVRERTLFPLD